MKKKQILQKPILFKILIFFDKFVSVGLIFIQQNLYIFFLTNIYHYPSHRLHEWNILYVCHFLIILFEWGVTFCVVLLAFLLIHPLKATYACGWLAASDMRCPIYGKRDCHEIFASHCRLNLYGYLGLTRFFSSWNEKYQPPKKTPQKSQPQVGHCRSQSDTCVHTLTLVCLAVVRSVWYVCSKARGGCLEISCR